MKRLAWLLLLVACDETPAAPPGGFRDVVDVDPDGETFTPEPAECEAIAAEFEAELYDPLLSVACTFCHREGGLAAGTDLVLVPLSVPDANQRNVATLAKVARKTIDGESVLLLRPTGRHPQGHPGGAPVDLQSNEYLALVDFVRAANLCRFDPPDGPAVCEPTGPRLLRRLSRDEWAQTIHDVLGIAVDPAVLAPDDVVDGFDNQAGALTVSALLVDQIRGEAERLARVAVDSRLAALVPCAPGSDECALRFVREVGLRLFRRPLTDGEIAAYFELYREVVTTESAREGLTWVLTALLQSPHFLYRSELGVRDVSPSAAGPSAGATFKLTDWEIASAISYLAWGTAPDDTLLRLASAGVFTSDATRLETELTRLLADPRADKTLEKFGTRWLRTDLLPIVTRDQTVYPEFTAEIRQDMAGETARFLTSIANDGGTIADLLLARHSFMTDRLAQFYGLPPGTGTADPQGFKRVDLEGTPYGGLLTRGALVATHSLPLSSSPIHRGKVVRERLLCEDLPPPPANLDTSPPPVDTSKSTRDRYATHASNQECATCHRKIDPIGFGLEAYDGVGRHRTMDGVHPIVDDGVVNDLDAVGRDVPFVGADGLAQTLASSEAVEHCFVLQQARFGWGYEPPSCTVEQLAASFVQRGGALAAAPMVLALSPAFLGRHGGDTELDSLAVGTFDFDAPNDEPVDPVDPNEPDPIGNSDGITWTTVQTNSWQTGYCMNVDVKNESDAQATWAIELAVEGTINNLWNAAQSPGAGGKQRFVGVEWNKSLAPGATAAFGFCAER